MHTWVKDVARLPYKDTIRTRALTEPSSDSCQVLGPGDTQVPLPLAESEAIESERQTRSSYAACDEADSLQRGFKSRALSMWCVCEESAAQRPMQEIGDGDNESFGIKSHEA